MNRGRTVILSAVLVRLVGAVITSLTMLNPESQADATGFAYAAAFIGNGLAHGQLLFPPDMGTTRLRWGFFLAPYWLLPGPSVFYGRVGNGVLGAFAIYNVYIIARYYHSHRAGVFAAMPMIVYPSFIAVQSTLLREAFVLFGITTAARLLIIPPETRDRILSYMIAGGVLALAVLHRSDNVIIYGAAVVIGLAVYLTKYVGPTRMIFSGALLWLITLPFSVPQIEDGVQYLAHIREFRARGRTVYLADTIPASVPELIAFSWVGAVYFLYAPLPWMITTPADVIVGLEGVISLAFTVIGIFGVKILYSKNEVATLGLLVGFTVGVVLYGVGTANFGTAMRHRQMFLWIVFLFGGIGIAEHFEFEWKQNR